MWKMGRLGEDGEERGGGGGESQGVRAICTQEDVWIVGGTSNQDFAWAEFEMARLHG